jgi:hypothetical protein
MKYQPCGKQSKGHTLKRLPDSHWDQNRSLGLKPFKLYDDDDDDDDNNDDKTMVIANKKKNNTTTKKTVTFKKPLM